VTGLLVFRAMYADRVYPAVVVGDVPVGGLTTSEAQALLTDRAADLEHGTITFSYQDQTWMPSLSELGANVKLEDSLAAAQQLGREGNAPSRLAFIGNILDSDQVVPLQAQVDHGALNAWFDTVDRDLGQPAVDAKLLIEDAAVTVEPGVTGLAVDREVATAYLLDALSSLQPVAVDLPTKEVSPAITTEEMAPVAAQVTAVLSEPVMAVFEDEQWEIEGTTVAPLLDVQITTASDTPTVRLGIDVSGLSGELRAQFGHVNRKPVNAVLGWDNGLTVIEPSITGAAMRTDAFAEAVADSFLNGHDAVEIPVVSVAPEIDDRDLDAFGITTLLGTGHSNFAGGNWERDENVRVATRLMNGTLVPPGGTFSFNRAIGEITADKGYQEALVVSGDRVGRDVGGGVCQVSTTIFRAALNAGMPIAEWYPHTFRLPDYERDGWGPGFDASILQWGPDPERWPDFKFENYTDNWLLVESYVSEPHVYVNIYGTGDGRTIDINAWSLGNNAFAFNRVIHDAQGNVIAERIFESRFK
jgi:vancomycin resistance protein YoaR